MHQKPTKLSAESFILHKYKAQVVLQNNWFYLGKTSLLYCKMWVKDVFSPRPLYFQFTFFGMILSVSRYAILLVLMEFKNSVAYF